MSDMISAVIITFNEEHNICKCIKSLKTMVAEIIVIDAFSTDDTVEIATAAGAKVVTREWKGYGSAKNYGASLATYEWIFSIDADERVTEQLSKRMLYEPLDESFDYVVRRTNIYRSKMMKFGVLHPQWKTRLYHKSFSKWNSRRVHEQLVSDVPRQGRKLVGDLIHHAYKSEANYRSKICKYAKLTAEEWKETHFNPPFISIHLGPLFHFLRSYFGQLGILEGSFGWQTSKGIYHYNKEKYRAFKSLNKK